VYVGGAVVEAKDVLYSLVEKSKYLWVLPTDSVHIWLDGIAHRQT
jgi:hypothetical protein